MGSHFRHIPHPHVAISRIFRSLLGHAGPCSPDSPFAHPIPLWMALRAYYTTCQVSLHMPSLSTMGAPQGHLDVVTMGRKMWPGQVSTCGPSLVSDNNLKKRLVLRSCKDVKELTVQDAGRLLHYATPSLIMESRHAHDIMDPTCKRQLMMATRSCAFVGLSPGR